MENIITIILNSIPSNDGTFTAFISLTSGEILTVTVDDKEAFISAYSGIINIHFVETGEHFKSEQETKDWMFDILDKEEADCIDNYRFALLSDKAAVTAYNEAEENGCCGYFDQFVFINGQPAKIGCNYGH